MVDFLTEKGMYCIRSAGSKGIVDVIAIWKYCNETFIYLIQCKYGKASMSKQDQKKLIVLADDFGCGFFPIYAYRDKYEKIIHWTNL